MSPTTTARPTTLLLALLALAVWLPSAAPGVAALPQLLIESGKAKCVQVSVPSSTHIRLEYEAPGKWWLLIYFNYRHMMCVCFVLIAHPAYLPVSINSYYTSQTLRDPRGLCG